MTDLIQNPEPPELLSDSAMHELMHRDPDEYEREDIRNMIEYLRSKRKGFVKTETEGARAGSGAKKPSAKKSKGPLSDAELDELSLSLNLGGTATK